MFTNFHAFITKETIFLHSSFTTIIEIAKSFTNLGPIFNFSMDAIDYKFGKMGCGVS